MECEIQLSSRSAAALLAQIYGPAISDFPHHRKKSKLLDDSILESQPNPGSWYGLMLNPQPLPPRERRVFALADAYIKEFVRLDRLGTMLGGEVADRVIAQSLRTMAKIGERCPAWPDWPEEWPAPPDPDPRKTMTPDELLVFGSLLLSASELIGLAPLRDALVDLSDSVLSLSMNESSHPRGTKPPYQEQFAPHDRHAVASAS